MRTKLFAIALIGSMSFATEAEGAQIKDTEKRDILFDFSEENPGEQWTVVNDNVMGGRSKGGFSFQKDKLIFSGSTNTNGGGFSSIRSKPMDLGLEDKDGLIIRFKGDGRTFKCGVRMEPEPYMERGSTSYRTSFETDKDAEGWQVAKIPFSSMSASWRGRPLSKERYPLQKDKIRSVTLMMYDKRDGPFELEVDSIKAYSDEVLCLTGWFCV